MLSITSESSHLISFLLNFHGFFITDESENLDSSEESSVDEALEEADANVDETDYESVSTSSNGEETTGKGSDSSDMTGDFAAANVDQSELEAEYEAATNSSGGAFSEKSEKETPALGGADSTGNSSPSEQASKSNSTPKEVHIYQLIIFSSYSKALNLFNLSNMTRNFNHELKQCSLVYKCFLFASLECHCS